MTDWGFPDFDAHDGVHLFTDPASGLQAVIAVHSTHLGPAAGGARFWHYATPALAITDALRLSRLTPVRWWGRWRRSRWGSRPRR